MGAGCDPGRHEQCVGNHNAGCPLVRQPSDAESSPQTNWNYQWVPPMLKQKWVAVATLGETQTIVGAECD